MPQSLASILEQRLTGAEMTALTCALYTAADVYRGHALEGAFMAAFEGSPVGAILARQFDSQVADVRALLNKLEG